MYDDAHMYMYVCMYVYIRVWYMCVVSTSCGYEKHDMYVYSIQLLVYILIYVCMYDRKNSHMEKDKDERWVCLYPGCGKPNPTGIYISMIYIHKHDIHTYIHT